MTANQLCQVLRTYTTLCRSWMAVLLWLLIHVMLWGPRLWSSEPLSELLLEIMCIPLMGSVALGTIMGRMLKLQFVNPRARLLPGFRAAHLVVAGAIVGAAIAIQAVLVPPGGGAVEPLALLSLTLLAIVAAAWIAYLMSPVGRGLIMALVFASIFAQPQYITGLIQALNDSPIVCLGIACVGLAAMAALGVRLWMLSEEMPEYSRQVPVFWISPPGLAIAVGGGSRRERLPGPILGWVTSCVASFSAATEPWARCAACCFVNWPADFPACR